MHDPTDTRNINGSNVNIHYLEEIEYIENVETIHHLHHLQCKEVHGPDNYIVEEPTLEKKRFEEPSLEKKRLEIEIDFSKEKVKKIKINIEKDHITFISEEVTLKMKTKDTQPAECQGANSSPYRKEEVVDILAETFAKENIKPSSPLGTMTSNLPSEIGETPFPKTSTSGKFREYVPCDPNRKYLPVEVTEKMLQQQENLKKQLAKLTKHVEDLTEMLDPTQLSEFTRRSRIAKIRKIIDLKRSGYKVNHIEVNTPFYIANEELEKLMKNKLEAYRQEIENKDGKLADEFKNLTKSLWFGNEETWEEIKPKLDESINSSKRRTCLFRQHAASYPNLYMGQAGCKTVYIHSHPKKVKELWKIHIHV